VIEETHDNIKLRFPFVVALMLVSVLLMFRRLWPVLVTGVVALVAVIWTMGFAILLRLESRRQPDTAAAIEQTFRYSGRGIVITTVVLVLVLVLGFSVFATSDYLSVYLLGTLLPLTLVVALVADLFLVPALVALGAIRFRGP
jgi:uncharacterized protein